MILNKGIIPESLQFNTGKYVHDLSFSKFNYDNKLTLMKKYPFYNSLGGLEKVLKHYADNSLSPLDEMILKSKSLTFNDNK